MSKISRTFVWWMPSALLLMLLGAQILHASNKAKNTVTARASWAFKAESVEHASKEAKLVVRATVINTEDGPVIPNTHPNIPDTVPIPTEHVLVRVEKVYRGTAQVGDTFKIFRTGGSLKNSTDNIEGKSVFVLEGDPPYTPGEEYLLMLVDGQPGTLRPISPEGRYRLKGETEVEPMLQTHVTKTVKTRKMLESAVQAKEN